MGRWPHSRAVPPFAEVRLIANPVSDVLVFDWCHKWRSESRLGLIHTNWIRVGVSLLVLRKPKHHPRGGVSL
ncbi:hypothetical protein BHM03_00040359 [Ensete ventricosum]|nr:hypothetical protein BHM03_00040359 [Ensete ventricosum]